MAKLTSYELLGEIKLKLKHHDNNHTLYKIAHEINVTTPYLRGLMRTTIKDKTLRLRLCNALDINYDGI